MRVLGIDPGLTRCGLGVVDGSVGRPLHLVEVGVVRTDPGQPTALRLCAPTSGPNTCRTRSEKPLITLGWRLKPGAELTMPNTRVHAAMRSRSPRARRRLPSIDSAVRRAAS